MLGDEVTATWSGLGLRVYGNNETYANISWETQKIGPTSDGKILPFQFIINLMNRRTVSSELQTASVIKIYINKHSKNKSIDHGPRQEWTSQAFPPPLDFWKTNIIEKKCTKS